MQHTLNSFVEYGMSYLSHGAVSIMLSRLSDAGCKFFEYVWPASEQVAGFAFVIFSFERLVAVSFPLHSKVWIT